MYLTKIVVTYRLVNNGKIMRIMPNMNIKEEIGKRIASARKAAGLTVKQLADRTRSLKPTRISNWEQGSRTPGPGEVLQLAEVLNVDPAFLLCLSQVQSPQEYFKRRTMPIVPLELADKFDEIIKLESSEQFEKFDHLLVDHKVNPKSFAIKIDDRSMTPEFEIGDIVIIDAETKPSPGKYVLAKLNNQDKAMLRKYREVHAQTKNKFTHELIPLNTDWPIITIDKDDDGKILGVMIEQRRYSR